MDAMNDPGPVDAFTAKVQAAQADLQHGIDRAGLRDDPFRHPLQALSGVLGLFPELVGQLTGAVDQARQPIDPVAVERAVERLEKAAARGADQRAAELARSRSYRALFIYGGVLLATALAAVGVGFAWGQASANAAVHQTEQQLALAFRDGPGAAAAWATLMRANDAGLLLAACSGLAVKTLEGRKACNMPVWLDPSGPVVPCCTAATQNIPYGNSPAVPAKFRSSYRVPLRPGRREDLGDGSIRASADVVGWPR